MFTIAFQDPQIISPTTMIKFQSALPGKKESTKVEPHTNKPGKVRTIERTLAPVFLRTKLVSSAKKSTLLK